MGGAAHRRVDGQARRRHRAGRPGAGPRGGQATERIARSCTSRSSTATARRGAIASGSSTSSARPASRSSRSSSTTRSTSPARWSRWEVATAFAGAVLGIDPFDQPNVEEAKELTRRVLAGAGRGDDATAARAGRRTRATAGSTSPSTTPTASPSSCGRRSRRSPSRTTSRSRRSSRRRPRSTPRSRELRTALAATGCATTAGYGPRFLHSTGQLHKGGPPTGVFLQLDLGAPGRSADPRLAVHVRAAHRRAGARRPRGAAGA